MKFDKRMLKNTRWWVCLPYTLLLVVLVIPTMCVLFAASKVGEFLMLLFDYANNHPTDILYIKAMTKWIKAGVKK